MDKDMEKKPNSSFVEKIKPLIFPFIYLALTITLAVSVYSAVKKRNYISIYIDGSSMQPTLNQNVTHQYKDNMSYFYNTEYGYADPSNVARNNISRFNVVITYYPGDYDVDGKLRDTSDYKIKRVIAMPGETFKIEQSVLTVIDTKGNTNVWDLTDEENRPFDISRNSSRHQKDHAEYTLGEDEYWVLGDNWNVSSDSQSVGAIKFNYIAGVLVVVQGTCTIVNYNDAKGKQVSKFTDYQKYPKPRYFI